MTIKNEVDVCIIGAGWSGLMACKYALENQLSVVVLEQRTELGGVWNYSKDPNIITVMESTITSSSATVTEAADFPIPHEMGNFVHRKDIQTYLENYANHFELYPHIRFKQCVENVEKQQSYWKIHCQEHCYQSKFLMICAGPYQKKRDKIPETQSFDGKIQHIGEIKSISPDSYHEHDNVLVYGGGESASDVVELIAQTPARITWAIPNGQHFFRKAVIFKRKAPGKYEKNDPALDEASSPFIQHICSLRSPTQSKPGMKWLCTLGSTGSVLNYEGHGIPEWKKGVPFLHAMNNKNGHAIEYVQTKRATAQGKIAACKGHTITFQDGHSDHFSHLILCTGYEYNFPYLPQQYTQKKLNERYKLIFDPDDTSLLFIGYARPNIGSIPLMTELQCFYAFKVLSGKMTLPNQEKMLTLIQEDIENNNRYFYHKRRADSLVSPFIYLYDLAKLADADINYAKLFFESPRAFVKTFFSPTNAAHFLLSDKTKRQQAIKQIWSRQQVKWFIWPLIFLISRLTAIDSIVQFFTNRKYQKQLQKK